MKKFFQLIIAFTLTCGLGGVVVSCSKDDPTENPSNDNGSLKLIDQQGTLVASGTIFKVEKETDRVQFFVIYIAPNGIYRPELITIEPDAYKSEIQDRKAMFFEIGIGTYTVKAENLSMKVEVQKKQSDK